MRERGWIVLVLAAVLAGCGGGDAKPKRTAPTAAAKRQIVLCEQLTKVAEEAVRDQMPEDDGEFSSGSSCLTVLDDIGAGSAAEAEGLVRTLPGACPGSTIKVVRCRAKGAGWDCDFRDSRGGTGSLTFGTGHPEVQQIC